MNIEVELQKATRGYLKDFNWTNPVAVTLTFKRAIPIKQRLVKGDHDAYHKNVRHFLNVLNKTIYRSLARNKWVMSVASVVETGAFDGIHYHLLIDSPTHIGFEHFTALIHRAWSKTQWGHHKIDVSREGGERW